MRNPLDSKSLDRRGRRRRKSSRSHEGAGIWIEVVKQQRALDRRTRGMACEEGRGGSEGAESSDEKYEEGVKTNECYNGIESSDEEYDEGVKTSRVSLLQWPRNIYQSLPITETTLPSSSSNSLGPACETSTPRGG